MFRYQLFLMRQVLQLGSSETLSQNSSGLFLLNNSKLRGISAMCGPQPTPQAWSSSIKASWLLTSLFPNYPAKFWIF